MLRAAVAFRIAAAILSATAVLLALAPNGAAPAAYSPPPIRHVFVIVLENESSSATFGSRDPYLGVQGTLRHEGLYLPNYYATGHVSNDNYVSLLSGQGPNPQNQGDCQIYDNFLGTGPTPFDGQAIGSGCVFPPTVHTLADQLMAKGLRWKGYMEDMGNDPRRESAVCGHPVIGTRDKTQSAERPGPPNGGQGDGYVSRHDPFVYFHSIINTPQCRNVVPLGTQTGSLPPSAPAGTTGLYDDLYGVGGGTTPNLSFIVPDLCDDGHDFPCTNEPSGSSALADMDRFLSTWVPLITASPAFRDGLLVVTFDEGAVPNDAASCCGELPGPNTPLPGITGLGGGKVGAVVVSPYITKGTISTVAYNHYALLGSIEDLFGLRRLGFAADIKRTFGGDVYDNPSGSTTF